jgi:hypothetical protein
MEQRVCQEENMAECDDVPQNFFSPVEFRFVSVYTPKVTYLAQRVNIPSVSVGTAEIGLPFVRNPEPGNMTYGDLMVEFKLDENLDAYDEILNWMESISHPDTLAPQYSDIKKDLRLIALSSSGNPLREFSFTEAYPATLSDLAFDTTLTDITYLTCTATFKFLRMFRKNL